MKTTEQSPSASLKVTAMACSRQLFGSVLLWFLLLNQAAASPSIANASELFDGNWQMNYSCARATGLFAERCLRGEGDYFQLWDLTQHGNLICGFHVATAYGQSKVDEGDLAGDGPSIYGNVNGNVATVHFRSAWTGSIGTATITRMKTMIVWHVIEPIGDPIWFPNEAVLSREASPLHYKPTACGPH